MAAFFSPFLEVVFPLPTENMVKGFLDLSTERDQNIFELLRYMVWMFLIYLIIKFTRPFLEFAAPTARRYSVTKPFRRIQGVITEFGLLGIIFAFISVVFVMPFGMKKTYEIELTAQSERALGEVRALVSAREKRRENLINIAIEGNEWLFQLRDKLNSLQPSLNNPYYVAREDFFFVASESEKLTSPPSYYTYYYYPTKDKPTSSNGNAESNLLNDQSENKHKISVINKIKGDRILWSHLITAYNSLERRHSDAERLYQQAAYEVMAILELTEQGITGTDYFVVVDSNHAKFKENAKNEVWAAVKERPFNFVSSSLKQYWKIGLILAIILYGISHTSVRYKIAPHYESVLRFFEQGRFGLGGSSRFAGIIEEWASLYKNQKEGIFLGRSLFNPFLNIGIEDKRHMLTVAATRAGKGTTAIIPNLLLWEGSTIVIDPKGTNAIVTANRRRAMGQNVYIVDPFNIVGEEETAKFNPLVNLDPDAETIREDISIIAEALVVPDPEQKERHWDDGARTVIAGLIAHLVSSGSYEKPTLSMIRDMLSLPPKEQEDLWLDMILNKKAGGLSKDAGSRVMRGISTNEINSIISNSDKHTEWLSAPTMKNALSKSTFEFSEMKEKPTTIYLVLPPNKLVTYNRFLRLFINQALSEISSGGRSKIPVLMIMDEFLALGRMEEVEKAFGLLAGYNLVMWPIVQEVGKLKDIYGSSFNSFINNSRGIQVFGVQGETAEFISNELGDRRTSGMTKKENWDRAAKLRAPNEVAIDVAVEAGWQYVLRSGKAPLVLEKVPYYKHPMFSGLYDKDPDYE